LRQKFPTVFVEEFAPGTMTRAGETWKVTFGPSWETRQVSEGVHWEFIGFDGELFEKVHIDNFDLSSSPGKLLSNDNVTFIKSRT
jgi:hypothetical protein